MKLWLISQDEKTGYDTYDSAVVAAETEELARKTCPSGFYQADTKGGWYFQYSSGRLEHCDRYDWGDWRNVTARYIGDAAPDTPAGVILASFNAG